MNSDVKKILKKYKRPRCTECNSVRTYTNPLAKCYLCQNKFCFDHIWSGQVLQELGINHECVELCDSCKIRRNPTSNLKQ